jgi:hypothetical protein
VNFTQLLPQFENIGVQGWVCWEEDDDAISGPWDHDVVECFTILAMPLFARRAFHTFAWVSEAHLTFLGPHPQFTVDSTFQFIPIRLSGEMIALAFLRRWPIVLIAGGIASMFLGSRSGDETLQICLIALGAFLFLPGLLGVLWLKNKESRTGKIRRLLGQNKWGSSDPVTWFDADLERIPEPQKWLKASCYSDAVQPLLEAGRFSRAMFAARMVVAREDPATGERLTTELLRHQKVRACLEDAANNPREWLKKVAADRIEVG